MKSQRNYDIFYLNKLHFVGINHLYVRGDRMKNLKRLAMLCCVVYFVSYITRINYAAVLAEIIADLGITKQLASIAVTGSFVTYGFGQIISGIIGDKFSPHKVILFGLIGTSAINLSMTFLPNIHFMNGLWCLNGFFQALMWPPLVRLVSEYFKGNDYIRVVARITQSSYAATIVVYAVTPLIITVSHWKTVFGICGTFGLAFAIVWLLSTNSLEYTSVSFNTEDKKQKFPIKQLISVGIIPILIAIIMQGFLRDGITTWMPTYISEVFKLGPSVSILSTAILPIFSIISLGIVTKIGKKIQNELKSAFVFFITALVCNIILITFFSKTAILDIVTMATITSCMHGINLMLIGNVPYHFSRFGKVSTVSGILNSATYIGAAVSTYAFAVISDKMGWNFTVCVWAVISMVGALMCFICIKKWKAFRIKK